MVPSSWHDARQMRLDYVRQAKAWITYGRLKSSAYHHISHVDRNYQWLTEGWPITKKGAVRLIYRCLLLFYMSNFVKAAFGRMPP
jgi:hypothetical protein